MTKHSPGMFVISLDFELYWGVHDHVVLPHYAENLRGVHTVVPKLLQLFEHYQIHVTWATVGFLFLNSLQSLQNHLPTIQPSYMNTMLNPYQKLGTLNHTELSLLFAPALIEQIRTIPHQEFGTHTFSHYYCLEAGQDIAAFRADLAKATEVAQEHGFTMQSIVFPRNQINLQYLSSCLDYGIRAYRGTEYHWIYQARTSQQQHWLIRAWRLLDAYLNTTSHHCTTLFDIARSKPYNISASRFLRPYNPRIHWLEPLRLQRIKSSMAYAAQHGKVFHLWWHPHNFGIYQEENLAFLRQIFEFYIKLQQKYDFQSLNMAEVTKYIEDKKNGSRY